MDKELLHRPALQAILTLATSEVRWPSRASLASECGFAPATFSHALRGDRGLSDEALDSMSQVMGIDARAALVLPWVAQPGDLRTEVLSSRLRSVQDELTDLHRAFRDYQRK